MTQDSDTVELATALTVAWLGNPNTRAATDDVPAFLRSMHGALTALTQPAAVDEPEPEAAAYTPAVSVRRSLASRDHIVSMIDGKPYRTLRRHLTANGLTPDEYRARYGLRPDYPMTAPSYSEARSTMAKSRGLGRAAAQKVEEVATDTVRKTRKGAKAALEAARGALGTGD